MAYQTLEELKAYMGLDTDDTDNDALLTAMLSRAQTRIETYCRTAFEASVDTTRKFDVTSLDYGGDIYGADNPSLNTIWQTTASAWNILWRTRLWFDQPLAQLTSVTVDGETLEASEYRLDPLNDNPKHSLFFTDLILSFNTTSTIDVIGRWAHSITAPDDIVHATTRLAQYYYEMRNAPVYDTSGSDDFGGTREFSRSEPMDVMYLIKPYRYNPILAR